MMLTAPLELTEQYNEYLKVVEDENKRKQKLKKSFEQV